MRLRNKLLITILAFISVVFLSFRTAESSEFNFAVIPIPSDYQIDTKNTYFDLLLKPNQEEVLQVVLHNDTEKNVVVEISVNSATTNSNVVVEYGANDIEKDASLKLSLQDYVEYPESIEIKPHSEETVGLKVKMPNEDIKGVLAGGITFKEKEEEETETTGEQGLSIKNEYSYVLALLMRQSTENVEPNLNLIEVGPGQINARNVILAKIQNDQKAYINQVVIESEITKKDKKEVLYSEIKERGQIAPNSNFSFPTSLKGEKLEAGKYRITLNIYANENEDGEFARENGEETKTYTNHWKLEKDFEIKAEEAKKLNEKDVSIKEDRSWLYILIGVLILLLVLLVVWLILRKKKKEEDEKKTI